MAKTASKSLSLRNSSQKSPFFDVLMYALYGHPRYFKFKRKCQQYGPCFQTIFRFLMTMFTIINISDSRNTNHKLMRRKLFQLYHMRYYMSFFCTKKKNSILQKYNQNNHLFISAFLFFSFYFHMIFSKNTRDWWLRNRYSCVVSLSKYFSN